MSDDLIKEILSRVEVIELKLGIVPEQYARCKVCGKKLKSKESKELGMGKTCYKKYIQQINSHKKLF